MSLFRQEVLDRQANRLYGEVQIALPGSWQLIGLLLMVTLLVGGTFLGVASYAHIESVSGSIVPDGGISTIVATRPGIVTAIAVDNGYSVRKSAALVSVNSEELGLSGTSSQEQIIGSIVHREAVSDTQAAAARAAAAAERSRDEEQILGLTNEIAALGEQIELQRDLVSSTERDTVRARQLADRGFVSKQDLQTREETLTVRRQQLSNVQQQKTAKIAALAERKRDLQVVDAELNVRLTSLAASRTELTQSLIDVEASRAYNLTSPVDGHVAGLTAHVGQAVGTNQPLMVIVPEQARFHAELYVSNRAIGFIVPGQAIHVAIDAFPYQRFGTLTAQVTNVSTAPMVKTDANGTVNSGYLVIAELPTSTITAFGAGQPLLPGMTLTARIVTQRQSLMRWLFEPIFAVQKR